MEDKNKQTNNKEEQERIGYVGNMWGWKFSYISLGIILFFIGFIALRHWMLGIPYDPSQIQMDAIITLDSNEAREFDARKSEMQQLDSLKVDSLQ